MKAETSAELDELKGKLEEAEKELKKEVSMREAAQAELDGKSSDVEKDGAALRQKIAELEADLEGLRSDSEKATESKAALDAELAELRASREALEADLSKAKAAAKKAKKSADEKSAALEGELDALKSANASKEEGAAAGEAALKDKIQTLEADLSKAKASAKKAKKSADEKYATLEGELDVLKSANASKEEGAAAGEAALKDKIAALEGSLEKAKSSQKKAKKDAKEKADELASAEDRLAAAERERDAAKEELMVASSSKRKKSDSKKAAAKAVAEIKSLRDQLEAAQNAEKDAAEAAEKERKAGKKTAASLQSDLDQEKEETSRLREELVVATKEAKVLGEKQAGASAAGAMALQRLELLFKSAVEHVLLVSHFDAQPIKTGAGLVRDLFDPKTGAVSVDETADLVEQLAFTGLAVGSSEDEDLLSVVSAVQFSVERASRDDEQLIFWLSLLLNGIYAECEKSSEGQANKRADALVSKFKAEAISSAQRAFALLVLCVCEKVESALIGVLLADTKGLQLPRHFPPADFASVLVDFALAGLRAALPKGLVELILRRVLEFVDRQIIGFIVDRKSSGVSRAGVGFSLKMALNQKVEPAFEKKRMGPSSDVRAELEDDEEDTGVKAQTVIGDAVAVVAGAIASFDESGGVFSQTRELANFLVMDKSLAVDEEAAKEVFPLLSSSTMAELAESFQTDDMCPDPVESAVVTALKQRAAKDGSTSPDPVGPDVVDVSHDELVALIKS